MQDAVVRQHGKTISCGSVLESDLQKLSAILKKTQLELEKEKTLRFEEEEKRNSIEKRFVDMTKQCRKLKSKCLSTEKKEINHQDSLLQSAMELSRLQSEYDNLYKYSGELEEELIRAKAEIQVVEQFSEAKSSANDLPLTSSTIFLDTDLEWNGIWNSAKSTSRIDSVLKRSVRKSSKVRLKRQWSGDNDKQRIIEEYMHITATAVKLHFPNVKIESAELAERVHNVPFYLF